MQFVKPIKFAVVGIGRIGICHVEQIVKTEGFQLTAVCDILEEPRQKAVEMCEGIATFDNFEELLAKGDFEVIVIATSSHFHYQMTLDALDSGRNVLCEKPMAPSAEEGRKMLAKARKMGKFLTVNQSMRYQYDTVAVKRIIDSGKIGRVFAIYRSHHDFSKRDDWQIWKKYYGGIVANWGVHLLDACMLMIDSKPETVFAKFNRILDQGDAEDAYKIVIRCTGGEIIDSEYLKSCHGKALWHVCGTKGSIYIDDTSPVIKIRVKTGDSDESLEEYDFREDTVGNISPHYKDLAEKLLAGQDPPITAESIITQLAVIDAARKSDATGTSAKVLL